MHTVIFGDGPMGGALADEFREAGDEVLTLGRPVGGTHDPTELAGADVTLDFSVGAAVAGNVRASLAAGCRRLVIGTTGWDADCDEVRDLLLGHGAAAVVAPTFSPGATILLDLIGHLGAVIGAVGSYDPYVVEWHRAGKRDRPSGTGAELARRLVAAYPGKRRIGTAIDGAADPAALELVSLRAGAAPGMHLVGFDAPGETLELRLTARDRRSYASGARLAAGWLIRTPRSPGIHPFGPVIEELGASASDALVA